MTRIHTVSPSTMAIPMRKRIPTKSQKREMTARAWHCGKEDMAKKYIEKYTQDIMKFFYSCAQHIVCIMYTIYTILCTKCRALRDLLACISKFLFSRNLVLKSIRPQMQSKIQKEEPMEMASDSNEEENNEEDYAPSFYLQMDFILWTFLNLLSAKIQFGVAYDMLYAGEFGDLVFQLKGSNVKSQLYYFTAMVGIPHRGKGSGHGQINLTSKDLSCKKGPYSLLRYYKCFERILQCKEIQGKPERLIIVTMAKGNVVVTSDCLKLTDERKDPILGLQNRELTDKYRWENDIRKVYKEANEGMVRNFLEAVRFVNYSFKGTECHTKFLEKYVQCPEISFLEFKEKIEEWMTSEKATYLTNEGIIRDMLPGMGKR
ncbi:uncharacterized protein LOC124165856 [Ischnura elegans]|uniref:uncharacterized protein LOC124165856 n=1 Tax=Ischnura elegans TaxID=197161 RepID=UPI001ED87BEE|nr:uncharacterized protein LOC124165856 [Ischnura elegans]